jgi:hypothetical protein
VCPKPQEDDLGYELLETLAGGDRIVVAITAFMDESGINPELYDLSVAAFYGTGEQWRAFRDKWIPSAGGFHAKDSTRLFREIYKAILKSGVKGVVVTVNKKMYNKTATAHQKTALGGPYSACALLCAETVCEQVNKKRVSFVLEIGRPSLDFVKRVLEAKAEDPKSCVAAVASAKKADFIELHTADFLSHVASSHDVEWLEKLYLQRRLVHREVTEDTLRESAAEITELFRRARYARAQAKRRTRLIPGASQP